MPTVQEIAANLIKNQAATLARTAKAVPEDKWKWMPLDAGRTVHDQVAECGGINFFVAKLLQAREVPPMDPDALKNLREMNDTPEKALGLLETGTETLVAAVLAFPEEHINDTITLPFGGGMTKSFMEIMLMPHWNMIYHEGQINYIQTLYGDSKMH